MTSKKRKPSPATPLLTPSSSSMESESAPLLAEPPSQPRATRIQIEGESFTARGVLVGLLVGLVICFSNMYFGLQTGWVSAMTMPASLLGFGIFRVLGKRL